MKVIISNCSAHRIQGDGISIEGADEVHIEGFEGSDIDGNAVNITPRARSKSWHERPSGALSLGLLAGVSVEALKRAVGLP